MDMIYPYESTLKLSLHALTNGLIFCFKMFDIQVKILISLIFYFQLCVQIISIFMGFLGSSIYTIIITIPIFNLLMKTHGTIGYLLFFF